MGEAFKGFTSTTKGGVGISFFQGEVQPRIAKNDLEAAAMRAFGYDPTEELMPAVIADMVVRYQESQKTGETILPYAGGPRPQEDPGMTSRFFSILWNKTVDALGPPAPGERPSKLTVALKLIMIGGAIVAVAAIVREVAKTYKAVT